MSTNPLNLALRFVLELVGLAAMAYWGWTVHEGLVRYLVAIGLPTIAAVLWGTFRVPNDPGKAPVVISGPVRLLLEIAYFGVAVLLLALAERGTAAAIFGVVILFHYAISYDRVWRLLNNQPVKRIGF